MQFCVSALIARLNLPEADPESSSPKHGGNQVCIDELRWTGGHVQQLYKLRKVDVVALFRQLVTFDSSTMNPFHGVRSQAYELDEAKDTLRDEHGQPSAGQHTGGDLDHIRPGAMTPN